MSDLIKDVLMGKIFGASSGTSGGASGGGGSAAVSPKEVNFYDYDGTCVYAYSVAEAQALSALPAGPEHPGLVFQGWNWSLEGVKGLTRAMNIGAMYTTDDGTTRLYITLQEGRTSPMLGVGVKGTVTVDWGDGTEPDVLTGTSVNITEWTPTHAYAAPGDYVIRLTVDGAMALKGTSSSDAGSCLLRHASGAVKQNHAYLGALRRLEIGSGLTSTGGYSCTYCYGLATVVIPASVTSIDTYFCYKGGYGLASVVIPDSVTSIGASAFYQCYGLASVVIPASVTSIGASAFCQCYNLASVVIPDSVTSIQDSTFLNCYSLVSVVFPASVTSIGANAFNSCYGAAIYDFTRHKAVPRLSNINAFSNIQTDCEIRVPAALYDEWIAATNWATYADYIKAY